VTMALRDRLRALVPGPMLGALRSMSRRFRPRAYYGGPIITEPTGRLGGATRTLAVVCGPHFRQHVPNAGVTYRLGLARGFEGKGVAYELVSVFDLARLRDLAQPIVFIAESDYEFLPPGGLEELRRHRHFVWVSPWCDGFERYAADHGFEGLTVSPALRERVLASEPAFVFAPATGDGLAFYEGWRRRGYRFVPLPLACDTTLYDRSAAPPRFRDVRIAFVGGYWPYKARSFDVYLKPHEAALTVFGYARWPYAGFRGPLAESDEPLLYRDAALCPAISEPHSAVMGIDIPERVFKVLGSGGLCLTDVVPANRDLFDERELMVPATVEEYHETVRAILRDGAAFARYRDAGYRAVRARHTYAHRAAAVLEALGLPVPSPAPAAETAAGVP